MAITTELKMPDELLINILYGAKLEVEKTLNLTDEEIEKEAMIYFKENKKRVLQAFLHNSEAKKRAIFSAGASGAGKSEFVKSLNSNLGLNIVDTDEIRKIFPYYSGKNASLFQRASIKSVEYLLDNIFKKELSFILDTNLASFQVAQKNIDRALKRGYEIELYFVYRDYEKCKELTIIREETEGRKVSNEIFNKKAIGSLESFRELVTNYRDDISLSIIDLQDSKIYREDLHTVLDSYEVNLKKYLGNNR